MIAFTVPEKVLSVKHLVQLLYSLFATQEQQKKSSATMKIPLLLFVFQ